MNEIILVYEWLYTILSANSTITSTVSTRIYDGVAPQGTSFPYIVFNWQGGVDKSAVGSLRVFTNGLFQVKVITNEETYTTISPVADKIDQLLHRAKGVVSSNNIESSREFPLAIIEKKDGLQYRHMGGIYRIFIS